jgi:hypothetical protein
VHAEARTQVTEARKTLPLPLGYKPRCIRVMFLLGQDVSSMFDEK